MSAMTQRSGLLAGGNFIIDHLKIIDYYPGEEMLATILSQSSSSGGGPYNVLKDLAKLGAKFPLEAAGLVGDDDGARWIFEDCAQHGIATHGLRRTPEAATSYTDAFTVASTGKRTFFHQPGANAKLAPADFDFSKSRAKIFYLGYLMLLDALDEIGPDGRTGASFVLEAARQAGLRTIADAVSKHHPRFGDSVRAALGHVDVLVMNEVESGRVVERDLRPGGKICVPSMIAAARSLLDVGVGEWVVLHAVEGAVAVSKNDEILLQGSLQLPEGFIKGATGAGDAFAAGLIHDLHENAPMEQCLRTAACVAAACLSHPSTSEGILPLAKCLALAGEFKFRTFSI